jgi:hypothetical protein
VALFALGVSALDRTAWAPYRGHLADLTHLNAERDPLLAHRLVAEIE